MKTLNIPPVLFAVLDSAHLPVEQWLRFAHVLSLGN